MTVGDMRVLKVEGAKCKFVGQKRGFEVVCYLHFEVQCSTKIDFFGDTKYSFTAFLRPNANTYNLKYKYSI